MNPLSAACDPNTLDRRPNALYLRRGSAESGSMASEVRPKGGWRGEKIWKQTFLVFDPCNHLKSHKIAKELFGNPWSETA
jgi:hypothetical protein